MCSLVHVLLKLVTIYNNECIAQFNASESNFTRAVAEVLSSYCSVNVAEHCPQQAFRRKYGVGIADSRKTDVFFIVLLYQACSTSYRSNRCDYCETSSCGGI